MSYLGDLTLGDTVDFKITTVASTGAPTTLAGSPVVSAYPGNSTTELTAGITLTVDFDGRTGMHNIRVVASAGNGYAVATKYALVITAGTVGGTSVVGYVVGEFTIQNRVVDVGRWLGTAAATPGTAGVPSVDAIRWATQIIPTPAVTGVPKTDEAYRLGVAAVADLPSSTTGTLASATGTTATLVSPASTVANYYNGALLYITGGTGAGQVRRITAYTTGRVVTVATWATAPDNTSTYEVLPDYVLIADYQSGLATLAVLTTAQADLDDIQTRLPAALVSGRMDASAGALAAGAVTAASMAADTDVYMAKAWLVDDNTGAIDHWLVAWFKNGAPVTSGITVPTIQIAKAVDGSNLLASTAMTQIGALGVYKYDSSSRLLDGAAYVVINTATIGGSTRTWYQPMGVKS